MRTLQKREDAEAQTRQAEVEALDEFNRRAAVNKACGMSARCPYAFQLSEEELLQAEADVVAGNPPLPIWRDGGDGMRILGDPWRRRDGQKQTGGWELLARVLNET